MRSKIFVLSGPSGSGKTTLIEKLFRIKPIKGKFIRGITFTTRPIRRGEKEGRDYIFVSPPTFIFLKRHAFFLEAKKTLGNLYGSPRFLWEEAKQQGKHLLLCLDVRGGIEIKDKFSKRTVLIFVLPPSLQEQKKRLRQRRTEGESQIKKRLLLAEKEVKYAKKYEYKIINTDLDTTVKEIKRILTKEGKS